MKLEEIKLWLEEYDHLDGASVLGFGFHQGMSPEEQTAWVDVKLYRPLEGSQDLVTWKKFKVLAKGWVQFSWVNLPWDAYLDTNWPARVKQCGEIICLDFDELHPQHINPTSIDDEYSNFFIAGKDVHITAMDNADE